MEAKQREIDLITSLVRVRDQPAGTVCFCMGGGLQDSGVYGLGRLDSLLWLSLALVILYRSAPRITILNVVGITVTLENF